MLGVLEAIFDRQPTLIVVLTPYPTDKDLLILDITLVFFLLSLGPFIKANQLQLGYHFGGRVRCIVHWEEVGEQVPQ